MLLLWIGILENKEEHGGFANAGGQNTARVLVLVQHGRSTLNMVNFKLSRLNNHNPQLRGLCKGHDMVV